jgi:hypothetical protein
MRVLVPRHGQLSVASGRIHDIRHTFGARAADAGVPLPAIKEMMVTNRSRQLSLTLMLLTRLADAGADALQYRRGPRARYPSNDQTLSARN